MLRSLIVGTLLACSVSAHANSYCDSRNTCIDTHQWLIGVNLGYGEKANPINAKDDIPIYATPNFAYYGKRFFVEDLDFGYTLVEAKDYSINAVTALPEDRAYFQRWDPSNIFVSFNSLTAGSIAKTNASNDLSKMDTESLADREFTVMAGLEGHYYLTQSQTLSAQVVTDALGVHSGSQATLAWATNHFWQNWIIDVSVAGQWKNKQFASYYYGVRPDEATSAHFIYQADDAINGLATLNARYRLNESWHLLLAYQYQLLADSIKNSPIVVDSDTNNFFLGASWAL
ncbi:MipA/OmpV family protein [Paraferrimonas haliotis]|uniref:Outer membrane MltA-interaction protein MipA n=1 Tax=Paraferrimonas haliotis TaxID=2013866 RepID=A0AA37TJW4_9GAMM|nr:MipA/OmpV family protein [Paraferrimonas haliotis]GLS82484.1 outer membrane MltA-interaction protein MipA [Paraferrimonas haliotis]